MIKRIALGAASIAAAAALALGLAAAGFGPVATLAAATADDRSLAKAAVQVPTEPVVEVRTETVYVKAAPPARVIHVTRRLPAAKPRVVTAVRHTTRGSRGAGDDGQHQGRDD